MGKKYLNEIYKDEWDTLLGDQSIYQENENELFENKTFTVTIVQPLEAVIEVVVNGTDVHTTTFTAHWDDTYTVRFKNGSNPNNLILNAIQGKVARDITIHAYDANTENKHETFTVTIVQSANQTISVLHNNVIKTKSFTAQRYDYYSATVEAIEGYVPGELYNGSGTIIENVTVSASPATLAYANYKTITILQSDHQTIVVKYNNKEYTTSFAAPAGARYTVSVKPDEGYNPGEVVDIYDGVVVTDAEIYAYPAIIKKYTIHIIQGEHQTIKVSYDGGEYTQDIANVPYGTQLTATLVPDEGYDPGKINTTSYRVTGEFTFECTEEAMIKYYTLTISATTNQTITVTYKLPEESSYGHPTNSGRSIQTLSLPYGTQWNATIRPDTNYKAGTLNASSGIIKSDTTISASNAVYNNYNVAVSQSPHQTIILRREDTGETSTSGWSNVPYGTRVTASLYPEASYIAGALNSSTKVIQSDFVFYATTATIITRTVTLLLTRYSRNPWIRLTYTSSSDTYADTGRLLTPYNPSTTITVKYNTIVRIHADSDPDYVRIYSGVKKNPYVEWDQDDWWQEDPTNFLADLHGNDYVDVGPITSNCTFSGIGMANRRRG